MLKLATNFSTANQASASGAAVTLLHGYLFLKYMTGIAIKSTPTGEYVCHKLVKAGKPAGEIDGPSGATDRLISDCSYQFN